jgi:cation diffusion facilitator family transporter
MSSSSITTQKNNNGTGHIIQSLIVNILIATSKGFAAFFTGSGAMLAETIHSTADCANQGLLLLGVKQSKQVADDSHPFGYGRSAYFWSFMVAMLLFSIGGMFSIYEGVHKFNTPEPIHDVAWAVGVLVFALVLESYATVSNVKEINHRRKAASFFEYLKSTKDSDLIVVFGENSAAVFGLFLALIALVTSYYTGDTRYDAMGSVAIGVVLILVAIFLAIEVKSLLIGESADPEIYLFISSLVENDLEISEILSCKTIQQGPGEVLVCMKIECLHKLNTKQISNLINNFEAKIRAGRPEVKWLYIEPDFRISTDKNTAH